MFGYNAISRHSRLGSDFDDLGVTFITLAPLLESILPLWDHFWSTLDAVFVSKTDWGAKGAQRGATPVSKSPFWTPVGGNFLDLLCTFNNKSCVLHVLVFSMNFGSH